MKINLLKKFSAGDKAGLKETDTIISVNGTEVAFQTCLSPFSPKYKKKQYSRQCNSKNEKELATKIDVVLALFNTNNSFEFQIQGIGRRGMKNVKSRNNALLKGGRNGLHESVSSACQVRRQDGD